MSAPLSVELLHLLVPAAEEIDLLEQHAADRVQDAALADAVALVQRCLGGRVLEG